MQRIDENDSPLQTTNYSSQKQSQQQPKALRFVTNYGAPHPKRRRIGAACLTCRKRKTACSGERPFCETCKQNKLECTGYSAETASPAASYKRTNSDRPDKTAQKPAEQHTPRRRSSISPGPDHKGKNVLHRTNSGGQSSDIGDGIVKHSDSARNGHRRQEPLFSGPRNRMPYFRWLGPTAIMPGFKQMVVKVRRQDTDRSTDGGMRSPSLSNVQPNEPRTSSLYSATPAAAESDVRTPLNLPFYDTSPMPPSELITHLANTFFSHVGCNYPFLQKDRFMRDLEEKQVDAILVDAVCAIAARFSTHPLLTQTTGDNEKGNPAEYGHAFAQRAKTALPDTYACPSVAAAQAALLLAYIEFGEQRDSGLWMYLGISIRLAQDLGLHKLEGLRYIGKDGPTPKAVKKEAMNGSIGSSKSKSLATANTITPQAVEKEQTPEEQSQAEETKAVEQERVDTFWAIFFLDRVVSSGTGRRSTLRDKEIELSFPSASQTDGKTDWPAPFPALIRIVHLYGRVADLLNCIKEPSDINSETPKRLAAMERQVTSFYQGLSSRLHFDAVNFQHYMKAGEGTNFVLLHFWFHTLIVLLHQPTLLKTFDRKMLQLFPNSQQLSMSSAKTIADILSYSQLMDAKAPLGNPFTSQPIYIAACAFLKETVEQTATSNAQSRASTPNRNKESTSDSTSTANEASRKSSISAAAPSTESPTMKSTPASAVEQKHQLAKHTLLATAATQHYQLCYKALQSLETYWAGAKYILTVLDQKFEGVGDPLLYTVEEGESSLEQPRPEPAFTSPGWRRKLSWGTQAPSQASDGIQPPFWPSKAFSHGSGSPRGVDPGKGEHSGSGEPHSIGPADKPYTAIGWTLTGNMDSSSANFACHYAGGNGSNSNLDPQLGSLPASSHDADVNSTQNNDTQRRLHRRSNASQRQGLAHHNSSVAKADGVHMTSIPPSYNSITAPQGMVAAMTPPQYPAQQQFQAQMTGPLLGSALPNGNLAPAYQPAGYFGGQHDQLPMNFMTGDMMIESQDVDMSMLGLDIMPWFDSYPTPDMLGMFDPNNHASANGDASGGAQQHGQR